MSAELQLGLSVMDARHDEFLAMLSRLQTSDDAMFMSLFKALIAHTKEHFSAEEAMMETHSFYGKQEHMDEHRNLLGEMEYFYDKAKRVPPFGRSYIDDYAYDKFRRHIINIDSQLAMFLKEIGVTK